MTPDRYQLVKRIFTMAAAADGAARCALLERECGGDAALRAEIESLLLQDQANDGFLNQAPVLEIQQILSAAKQSGGRPTAPRPERIGQYRILDVLGEGGMGVVYLAEQDNPRRPVALKVIRPGVASESMLRRFQYEAQLLGRLHHPGIAQIYEAGAADTGCGAQPFLAMELVKGLPLRDYVNQHELTIRQKLELLAKICDAVHHAHQKGIIHRDLKPGNILVEDLDRKAEGLPSPGFAAQPKILDFGVARAIEGADDPGRERTIAGQLVGTIAYMSPEQLAGEHDDIDIRTDVYSLGVLYYELLSGRPPHDLERKRLPECMRAVLEDEIRPLGARDKSLRGDLQTIVAKALEKNRARRYQSALELAEDTRRFLSDRPIAARPPSTSYFVRKFVKRNKIMVSSAVVAVILGAAGLTWHIDQLAQAHDNLLVTGQLRQEMEDPLKPAISDTRSLALVSDTARFVERKDAGEAARIHNSLGLNYMKMSLYPEARFELSRALEIRTRINAPKRELAESHHNMGRLLFYEGRLMDSIAQYQIALQMRTKLAGENAFDHDVAQTMHHLASCYRKLGQDKTAERFAREALAMRRALLGPRHSEVAAAIVSLAMILRDQDELKEAAALFREALEIASRISAAPNQDMRVAGAMTILAECLIELGEFDEALELAEQSLRMKQEVYPKVHPSTAQTLAALARLREKQERLHDAEQLARKALRMQEATQSSNHLDLGATCALLGEILLRGGHLDEAEPFLRRALRIRLDQLPPQHRLIAQSQMTLGECITGLGRFAEAELLLLDSREILLSSHAGDGHRIRAVTERLIALYDAMGQSAKADEYRAIAPQQ